MITNNGLKVFNECLPDGFIAVRDVCARCGK